MYLGRFIHTYRFNASFSVIFNHDFDAKVSVKVQRQHRGKNYIEVVFLSTRVHERLSLDLVFFIKLPLWKWKEAVTTADNIPREEKYHSVSFNFWKIENV